MDRKHWVVAGAGLLIAAAILLSTNTIVEARREQEKGQKFDRFMGLLEDVHATYRQQHCSGAHVETEQYILDGEGDVTAEMRNAEELAGDAPAGQQVALPDNEGKFYFTILLHESWKQDPESRQLRTWLKTDPRLVQVQERCIVNSYTSNEPVYRRIWAPSFPPIALPAIVLQGPGAKGPIIYRAENGRLPSSPEAMIAAMSEAAHRHYPELASGGRFRPRPGPCHPRPKPGPDVNPPVEPSIQPLDDPFPADPEADPAQPADEGVPAWVLVLCAIGGIGIGLASKVIPKFRSTLG